MDVDHGYISLEKFWRGVQWYIMSKNDIFPSFCFELQNETFQLVSFKSQSINFRFSIEKIKIQHKKVKDFNKIKIAF